MARIVRTSQRAIAGAMLVSAVILAAGCGSSSSASPDGASPSTAAEPSAAAPSGLVVTIQGNVLPDVTAAVDEVITWQNNDGVGHTVTPDDGSVTDGQVPAGGTFSHAFETAGTYPYHCAIHPTMTATITITE